MSLCYTIICSGGEAVFRVHERGGVRGPDRRDRGAREQVAVSGVAAATAAAAAPIRSESGASRSVAAVGGHSDVGGGDGGCRTKTTVYTDRSSVNTRKRIGTMCPFVSGKISIGGTYCCSESSRLS